eukprot:1156762-Pelagomonas_calceolata.AAC.6
MASNSSCARLAYADIVCTCPCLLFANIQEAPSPSVIRVSILKLPNAHACMTLHLVLWAKNGTASFIKGATGTAGQACTSTRTR